MKTNLRLKLTAVFEAAPEGGYTCYFEEFPDVFSEGETIESAKANLHDALQLVLEYHRDGARKKEKPSTKPWRVAVPDNLNNYGDLQSPVMDDWTCEKTNLIRRFGRTVD